MLRRCFRLGGGILSFFALLMAGQVAAAPVHLGASTPDRDAAARSSGVEGDLDRSHDERVAIQDALIWAGHYHGQLDGDLSGPARFGIKRFQEQIGVAATGVLSAADLKRLFDGRRAGVERAGFRVIEETVLGIRVGLPHTLLRRASDGDGLVTFEPVGGAPGIGLALVALEGSEKELRQQRAILMSSQLVGDAPLVLEEAGWFLIAGHRDDFRSYAHLRSEGGMIRGFILTWTADVDAQFKPVAAAMFNSFEAVESWAAPRSGRFSH